MGSGIINRLFGPEQSQKKKILIVDDETDILKLLEIHFKHLGLDVTLANSAVKAKGLLEKNARFDLFILDINMPAMTGDELARFIRGLPSCKETPILILTGVLQEDDMLRLERDLQNLACLSKPFDARELKETVSNILKLNEAPESA